MRKTTLPMMILLLSLPGRGWTDSEKNQEVGLIPAGERQLFLDDLWIAEIEHLERSLHQPEKKGAVILPDRPWEVALQTRCAPAWDVEQGLYKLWMITSTKASDEAGTSYAESPDGIHWTKPNLGQCQIQGSLENNFVTLDPSMKWPENAIENVVYDPDDPNPERRFKGFLGCYDREPIFSPDGIHWTRPGVPKIPSQDESNLSFDPQTRTFIATLKQTGPFGRSHGLATSHDFLTWTAPELVFHADQEDQILAIKNIEDRLANPHLVTPLHSDPASYKADIYNFPIFRYEGLYLSLPAVYHTTSLVPGDDDGFHLIQLACSRDLHRWNRVGNRQTFIGPSPRGIGAYDTMQLLPPSAPVLCGEEMRFYYTGIKYRSLPQEHDPTWGAICMATLRRDGFLSLDADETPGTLVTKPFRTHAFREVHVNVDSPRGEVILEILDEKGISLAESAPITTDSMDFRVEWNHGSVEGLHDHMLQLRFHLKNASLYSFWLSE